MGDFDGLDLQAVENQMEFESDEFDGTTRIVLAILDGSTPPGEWIEEIDDGAVLVLSLEGDLNELAAGFAREVSDAGGELMHFREFLVVTPPGVTIDTDRLN